jgi:hypothetical protein
MRRGTVTGPAGAGAAIGVIGFDEAGRSHQQSPVRIGTAGLIAAEGSALVRVDRPACCLTARKARSIFPRVEEAAPTLSCHLAKYRSSVWRRLGRIAGRPRSRIASLGRPRDDEDCVVAAVIGRIARSRSAADCSVAWMRTGKMLPVMVCHKMAVCSVENPARNALYASPLLPAVRRSSRPLAAGAAC